VCTAVGSDSMIGYIGKRLLITIPILLGISIVIFFVANSMPGDVLDVMVNPTIGKEQMELRRAELGLDQPIYVRYWQWVSHAVLGDFGYSLVTREPVAQIIGDRIPNTVLLMGMALLISLVFAIPAGIISAVKKYSMVDYTFTIGAFVGISVPTFFFGLILIYLFSVRLGWLPSGGTHSFMKSMNPLWTEYRI
jgi:peptide/nickel transport system permease protein